MKIVLLLALIASTEAAIAETPPIAVVQDEPVLDANLLAVARSVATKFLPSGSFRRAVEEPPGFATAGLTHRILMQPVFEFAKEVGVELPPEGIDGPPFVRVQILHVLDPVSLDRATAMGPIVDNWVVETAEKAAPKMREALAIAYGQRLTIGQLRDLDNFLSTPSGAAYAAAWVPVQLDPGVSAAGQMLKRSIDDSMPLIFQRVTEGTKNLPRPKTAAQLTEEERRQIATLLRVAPAKLKPKRR